MVYISLVTANIEYGHRNLNLKNERSNILSKNNPDIILVQEGNFNAIDLTNYHYIENFNNKNTELMDIYLKKNSEWEKDSVIEFFTELSDTVRLCKIITVKHKEFNKKIKIANIHLCGGRFDESDKIGKMLIGNLKDIRKRKNEILEKLVKMYNVDIIVGDFNSDINCYINNGILQKDHLKYLQKISPNKSMDIYKEWNIAPFNYLNKNEYALAFKFDSNKKYTSIYKNHPDSVWYKNELFNVNHYEYVDLIKLNLSDHNGIYTNFELNI